MLFLEELYNENVVIFSLFIYSDKQQVIVNKNTYLCMYSIFCYSIEQ